jgi:hypothetical protein
MSLNNRGNAAYLVRLPARQRYTAEIFAADGRRFTAVSGISREFRLGTRSLPPGVYALTVRGAFGTLRKRIAILPSGGNEH